MKDKAKKPVPTKTKTKRNRTAALAIIGLLVLAAVVTTTILFSSKGENKHSVVTPTANAKETTWKLAYANYTNNRWFGEGIVEIRDAKTDAQASDAAFKWLERVKTDPNLLTATAKTILNRDIDKKSLFSKDGWATDKCASLVAELQLALGQAKIVSSDAPSDGFNTGVENGTVVGASSPGINGDRKAVQITLADGRVIWIMWRCGNIVTLGPPPLPPGKTDNAPLPIVPTDNLTPKDPSKDVGANPLVDPWKKDDTGGDASRGHQVSNGDGATISNGLQPDPETDAAIAKALADAEVARLAAEAEAARLAAIVVDNNQDHTESGNPGW